MAGNAVKTGFFSICLCVTLLVYQNAHDVNFTSLPFVVLKIQFGKIGDK